jgi:CelD/BcsL family acetyltransferase involved in cellulose biosynthesis
MLVSSWMVLQRSKDAVPEFFVKGLRLKTEGVEERICAVTLGSITLRTLHQFLAETAPSYRRSHGKRSDV